MAQQARVDLIDKIDGGTGNETITFGLDEATDEIDLSECDAAPTTARTESSARRIG